jgi:NADPH:quinone reductase-like Zn-dependent oxidoreductase
MKAIGIRQFGGRDALEVLDVPEPECGPGDVLIDVKAAGVNPVDWKIREGWLQGLFPHEFPVVLGWDVAGVVRQAGPATLNIRPGDAVFAYCRKSAIKDGSYAERIVLPEYYVCPAPTRMSMEEAASVPLAGLTAYQALFDAARLLAGETVLVHAAAGGVGGFAVQLARQRGARVLGTASRSNHEYVRGLGAAEVIDYTAGDFRPAVRAFCPDGADVILDGVGGDTLTRSVDVLKPGGRLISIVESAVIQELVGRGIKAQFVFVAPNGRQLAEIRKWIEQGAVKSYLSAAWPLEKAAKAHQLIETRHTRGKIALKVA